MSRNINFERAFSTDLTTCYGECSCGKEYYDYVNFWENQEGELKELQSNKNAIGVDHSIGFVQFEGKQYVNACDCWEDRANMIMNFIDGHNTQIAEYLNAERRRKISEAELVQIVEG